MDAPRYCLHCGLQVPWQTDTENPDFCSREHEERGAKLAKRSPVLKPTIEELEAILNGPECLVLVRDDGSLDAVNRDDVLELRARIKELEGLLRACLVDVLHGSAPEYRECMNLKGRIRAALGETP